MSNPTTQSSDLEALTKMLQKAGMKDVYHLHEIGEKSYCLVMTGNEALVYVHTVVFEFKEGSLWRVRKW